MHLDEAHRKTKEMAIIAVGVAIIIGGGIAIFIASSIVPMPGVKYILLSPYLSMVTYVIQLKAKSKLILLKFGAVFAMTMTMISLFMGGAILLTAFLAQFSIIGIKNNEIKVFWGSVMFSGYMGVCALAITRLFINSRADILPNWWILVVGLLSAGLGIVAVNLSKSVLKRINILQLGNE